MAMLSVTTAKNNIMVSAMVYIFSFNFLMVADEEASVGSSMYKDPTGA